MNINVLRIYVHMSIKANKATDFWSRSQLFHSAFGGRFNNLAPRYSKNQ